MKIILSAFGDTLRSDIMEVPAGQGDYYYLPVWKPFKGWELPTLENATTGRTVFKYMGREEILSNSERCLIYDHQPDET